MIVCHTILRSVCYYKILAVNLLAMRKCSFCSISSINPPILNIIKLIKQSVKTKKNLLSQEVSIENIKFYQIQKGKMTARELLCSRVRTALGPMALKLHVQKMPRNCPDINVEGRGLKNNIS